MLARFADNIFWLARYMERADGLARLLDVTETHARDEKGAQDWAAILDVNGDLARYQRAYGKPTPADVVFFYTLDANNPASLLNSVAMARENARSIRHLISTEMWAQINVFNTWIKGVKKRDVQSRKLSSVCTQVRENCQAHTGITEATLYRDQAWLFYWIGKMVERADQASRVLDVGFIRANPADLQDENKGEHLSHWNALLRSLAGYHAYRRTHPVRLRAHEVAHFILADPAFPRSMLACVNEAQMLTLELIERHDVKTAKDALAILGHMQAKLNSVDTKELSGARMHAFVDGLQRDLIAFTNALAKGCFGWGA